MRAKDRDESAADRKERRGVGWGIGFGGLMLVGIGAYYMVLLLFGTREHGTVGDCTEHPSGRSTTTWCDLQLTNGSTTTVNFGSSPGFGHHVSLTMWGGHVVEVGQATERSWMGFVSGGLILTAIAVWLLQHPRVRTQDEGADVPSG